MNRVSGLLRAAPRAFAPSASARAYSVSKLTLLGHLASDPEVRTTKNEKEYIAYTVATTNYPPPPPGPDGTRPESTSSFHKIFSFSDGANNYIKTLRKGALVYVEANFELRETRETTENGEILGVQRQVFCRHETLRVIKHSKKTEGESSGESSE
ncbi:hypothetical protein EXIGLDRAFT_828104 [Exidia glandulosa HHB12029]|uniref:Nucleic acid-binding protein n=1 Tax=Exidia glandulosa HHB12029 TaxID=1314781 RepID=A0A165QX33_EXIGL|nr:hypothetical protein EXIGLDRAFT_828104 [Exidia glandulosa HHB12029]